MHGTKRLVADGFTLLEIAVVLAIIGVIIAGSLSTLVVATQSAQVNDTAKRFTEIEKRLLDYSLAFGRIPCPSSLVLKPEDADYGKEAPHDGTYGTGCIVTGGALGWTNIANENDAFTVGSNTLVRYGVNNSYITMTISGNSSCSNTTFGSDPAVGYYKTCQVQSPSATANYLAINGAVEGAIPVRALNLPDSYMYDSWGHKLRYAVNPSYTNPSAFPNGGLCGTQASGITVKDAGGIARTTHAVYALISHGKNGHGGFNRNGSEFNASSTNTDELINCHCDNTATDTSYNATYVEKLPTANSASLTDSFDDIVSFREAWQMQPDTNTASAQCLSFEGQNPSGGDNTGFIDAVQLQIPGVFANNGFETPAYGNGNYGYPAVSGWTFNGAGVSNNNSAWTSGGYSAPEGSQVVMINNTQSISQAISPPAGTYMISFLAARRSNWGGSNNVQVLVDGNSLGNFYISNWSYGLYVTTPFTTTGGYHNVTFQGLNTGGDDTAFIDNVQLAVSGFTNWNFESPGLAGGTYSPTATGWTFFGFGNNSSGINSDGGPITSYCHDQAHIQEGWQIGLVQRKGSFSQAFMVPPGTYQLQFLASDRNLDGDPNNANQLINVVLNGNVIMTVTPPTNAYLPYASSSFTIGR